MKKSLAIASVESKVTFKEKILVDFVNRNLSTAENLALAGESFSDEFSTITWASTNIPVNGSLDIIFADQGNIERISLPVCSFFIITCTKETTGICKVAWSYSLS